MKMHEIRSRLMAAITAAQQEAEKARLASFAADAKVQTLREALAALEQTVKPGNGAPRRRRSRAKAAPADGVPLPARRPDAGS